MYGKIEGVMNTCKRDLSNPHERSKKYLKIFMLIEGVLTLHSWIYVYICVYTYMQTLLIMSTVDCFHFTP